MLIFGQSLLQQPVSEILHEASESWQMIDQPADTNVSVFSIIITSTTNLIRYLYLLASCF